MSKLNGLISEMQSTEKRKFEFTKNQILEELNRLRDTMTDEGVREAVAESIDSLKGKIASSKLDREYRDMHINVMEDIREEIKKMTRSYVAIGRKLEKLNRDVTVGK